MYIPYIDSLISTFFPQKAKPYLRILPSGMSLAANATPYCFSSICLSAASAVKPKLSPYLSEVAVTTSSLFRSEKIDSLLTLVMPVITERSK